MFQWHCANIEYSTATDIHNLSARHWAIDDEGAFEGPHCLLRQGYGALARGLAQHLDEIRLQAEVASVRHAAEDPATGAGGGCVVTLRDGSEVDGDMVLVTLPLGVLKARAVRFEPELPAWKTDAIDRMGYGLLNKVAASRVSVENSAAHVSRCRVSCSAYSIHWSSEDVIDRIGYGLLHQSCVWSVPYVAFTRPRRGDRSCWPSTASSGGRRRRAGGTSGTRRSARGSTTCSLT